VDGAFRARKAGLLPVPKVQGPPQLSLVVQALPAIPVALALTSRVIVCTSGLDGVVRPIWKGHIDCRAARRHAHHARITATACARASYTARH